VLTHHLARGRQIRLPALNMTHTDPFGGGGWGGRVTVTGHTTTLPTHTVSPQPLTPATQLLNFSTHTTDQARYDILRSLTLEFSDPTGGHPLSLTHLDLAIPTVHAMRPHSHTEYPQFNSNSVSGVTVTYPTTLDSALGSVPEFSPHQSPETCTSTSPHGRGGGHGGHAEASSARHEPDSTTRDESALRLGNVGREATHVGTLMQGGRNYWQSIFTVQPGRNIRQTGPHCATPYSTCRAPL
jgi:hypothetical protein